MSSYLPFFLFSYAHYNFNVFRCHFCRLDLYWSLIKWKNNFSSNYRKKLNIRQYISFFGESELIEGFVFITDFEFSELLMLINVLSHTDFTSSTLEKLHHTIKQSTHSFIIKFLPQTPRLKYVLCMQVWKEKYFHGLTTHRYMRFACQNSRSKYRLRWLVKNWDIKSPDQGLIATCQQTHGNWNVQRK